jgi:hypothetical protein
MSVKNLHLVKVLLAIFCFLAGAGLIFTGIGIIGTFFLWWIGWSLLTK